MKQLFKSVLVLSATLLLSNASLAQEKNQTANHSNTKEEKMSTHHNKETVRKLYENCLNKRNFELLKEFVSEDYAGPRGEKGPAGVEQTIRPLISGFPDIQWTVEELLEEGDKVIVRWTWLGTHTGNYQNIPASNKTVRNDAIAIYQFKNGKIVGVTMQTDRLGFLIQTGVVSADVVPGPAKK